MEDSFKEILELIVCPVCFEQMYPPIFQCPNGHTLCSSCKRDVDNKCPSCRVEMGDIRSLVSEMLLSTMKLPCKHKSTGCNEIIRYEARKQHEDNCNFRPYNCPFPCSPCYFTGDISILLIHMRNIHDSTFEGNTGVIDTLCRSHRSLYCQQFCIKSHCKWKLCPCPFL